MTHDITRSQRSPLHFYDHTLNRQITLRALYLIVVLILMIGTQINPTEARSNDFTKAAKRAMPAVVSIQVIKRSKLPQVSSFEEEFLKHFFGPSFPSPQDRGHGRGRGRMPRGGEQQGQGSGFVISEDGYILTNNHVVGGADEILVQTADGRSLKAQLVGTDEKSDVAVIKVEKAELPKLTIGNSSELEIGEWVLAVGNPFGLSATLTVGVVSATGRAGMGITDYEEFIQTDAAINPGNSGGPLLNIEGEVVGINTAIYSRSGGYMGIGFAIPINMALKIKDQLIEFGEVRRGRIGAYIQELGPELATKLGLENVKGVLISDIVPDSPASRGGLKAGDVVIELNKTPVTTAAMFRNRISLTEPNSVVKLKIIRDQSERVIKVKIGALGGDADSPKAIQVQTDRSTDKEYGLEIQEIDDQMRTKLKMRGRAGVLISDVVPGSPADEAGLRAGQVILSINQKDVEGIDSFKSLVAKAKGSLLLHVKSERGVRFIVLAK